MRQVVLKRPSRARSAFATAIAVALHLLALLGLGWRIPRVAVPDRHNEPDSAVELTLIQPDRRERTSPASAPAAAAQVSRPRPEAASPGTGAPAPLPMPSPASGALAAGPSDCEVEDLPLLTEAERVSCRNQIDAERARRAARGADERLARQVAGMKAAPYVDSIPAEKRAYYDAVSAAYTQQSHGPPMAGKNPGIGCSIKFDGLRIVKTKPPPKTLSVGPCFLAPPQGFLTEESGIAPP